MSSTYQLKVDAEIASSKIVLDKSLEQIYNHVYKANEEDGIKLIVLRETTVGEKWLDEEFMRITSEVRLPDI